MERREVIDLLEQKKSKAGQQRNGLEKSDPQSKGLHYLDGLIDGLRTAINAIKED